MSADGGNDQSRSGKRTALILYGSETGNAQEVAEELGQLVERLHFITHVYEFNAAKAVSKKKWPSCFFLSFSPHFLNGNNVVMQMLILSCFFLFRNHCHPTS